MPRRKVSPVVTLFAFASSSRVVPTLFVVLACPLADRVAAEEPEPKQAFVMPQRSDRPMNSLRKKPNAASQNKDKTNAPEKPSGKLSYLPTEDPNRDKAPVPTRPNSNDVARRSAPQPSKAVPQSPKYAASAGPKPKGVRTQIAEPRAVASQPIPPGPKATFSDRIIGSDLPTGPTSQRTAMASTRSEHPSVADGPIRNSLQAEDLQPPLPEVAENQIPRTRPSAPPIQDDSEEFETTDMAVPSAKSIAPSSNMTQRAAPTNLEEKFFVDDEPEDDPPQRTELPPVASRNAVHEVELDLEELHPVQREPARRPQLVADDPFEMPIRVSEDRELPDDIQEDVVVVKPLKAPLGNSKEPPVSQSNRNVAQRFFEDEPTDEESDEVMELVEQPNPSARRHSVAAPDERDEPELTSKVVQAIQEVESPETSTPESMGPSKAVLSQLKPVRTIELRKAVEVLPLADGDNPQLKEPVDQASVVLRRRTPFHFWPVYRDPWRADRDSYPFSHYPLWFEDPNMERCGRGFGHFTTTVSVLRFAANIPILPYRMTAEPACRCVPTLPDCTVCEKFGCQDYLPPWSWSAAAVQAAATVGCIYVFP